MKMKLNQINVYLNYKNFVDVRPPVLDQRNGNLLYFLTHKRILRFLFLYVRLTVFLTLFLTLFLTPFLTLFLTLFLRFLFLYM